MTPTFSVIEWKQKAGEMGEKAVAKKEMPKKNVDVMAPTHFPRHHMTQSENSK